MADQNVVELPEELIQHIQSFLDPKEAANTSFLSKLWYSAWSTRLILSLDYSNFYSTETRFTEFQNFARTSINRYRKLNRKPNTFELIFMNHGDYDKFTRVGDELILSALNLGVNDLQLKLRDLSYTLPDQVFSSICLKKLCIHGNGTVCSVALPRSRLLCSQLVSLELSNFSMNDDMMKDILSGCPMLEDLRVGPCYGLEKINLSVIRCNLRTFHADFNSIYWTKLSVEWDEFNVQHQYHNLISLKLSGVKVDDLFFEFFPHRFPCLERLELQILKFEDFGSNSLRHLSLSGIDRLNFTKVQAPNIQNFTLETEHIRSLSIRTTTKDWKSYLRFFQPSGKDRDVQLSWWLKIRDILTELSPSKISIAILLSGDDRYLGSISEEIINHISPFVENLKIQIRSRGQNYLFGWLLCCRPKYITCLTYKNLELELVYNELKKHENKIASYPLPCIHGLDEVDMEHYHQTLREWRPVQPGTEEAADVEGEFRLRLKWT